VTKLRVIFREILSHVKTQVYHHTSDYSSDALAPPIFLRTGQLPRLARLLDRP